MNEDGPNYNSRNNMNKLSTPTVNHWSKQTGTDQKLISNANHSLELLIHPKRRESRRIGQGVHEMSARPETLE